MLRTITFCLLILLLNEACTAQQGYQVERISIRDGGDDDQSFIPRVSTLENTQDKVSQRINEQLTDVFNLNDVKPEEHEFMGWHYLDFTSTLQDSVLMISFSGEWVSAYGTAIEKDLFYNLNSGEEIIPYEIPFHQLFTLKGYLAFMNKYWLERIKEEFKIATACAESEPDCSHYNIAYSATSENIKLDFKGSSCYPHVAQACNPTLSRSIPLDSVESYLNEFGKQVLLLDQYGAKTGINRLVYGLQLKNKVPNNQFYFGKIDGKYPFSLAVIPEANSDHVQGFYYYDKVKKPLTIQGTQNTNTTTLEEIVDGITTGKFSWQWHNEYVSNAFYQSTKDRELKYLTGTWQNADGSKSYLIEFRKVLGLMD